MKKIITSKKAEGYIDVVIGIFAMMMVLVLTLNIFEFMTLKQDLDEISGQLIETATFNGCFDSEFDERVESLKNQFFDFNVNTDASALASFKSLIPSASACFIFNNASASPSAILIFDSR